MSIVRALPILIERKFRALGWRARSVFTMPNEFRVARRVRNDPLDRVLKNTETWNEHVAVVATYPRSSLAESVRRLLACLQDAGTTVVLVMNDSPDRDFCLDLWIDQADVVIQRPNLGRDFGCYQRAMSHLEANAPIGSITRVSYFNDSVIYLPTSSQLIGPWLQSAVGTCALSISGKLPLAHTYAITIDQNAAFSQPIRQFWKRLLLSNTRRTVVRRGEIKFSHLLRSISEPPLGYMDFNLVDEALNGDWGLLAPSEARGLQWANNFEPRIAVSASISEDDQSSDSPEVRRRIAKEVPKYLGPNHAFGLVSSRLFGFPLKIDILSRVACTSPDVSELLDESGVGPEEQKALVELLGNHRSG